MNAPRFAVDEMLTWADDAPATWRFIYTPGPMFVVDRYYHDGSASEYAKRFSDDGMAIKPGWIYIVSYEADSTDYYNPPRSLLFGTKVITTQVHEMWLKPFEG